MNLICGINPVLEALGAGTRHFDRLLVVKGLRNKRISDAISRAGHLGIPLRFEARETLDRMAAGVPHQGLIAVVSAKPVTTVEKVLEEARTPALVVVLDGVEDPRNLGAILRTVEAAGADGVLLPDRHSAGLSETVNRASAGGLEHVKVASIGNVVQAIEALKKRGLWIVGFDASGTERWDAIDYRRPIALVLGGEGKGIRRLVREHCDHLVSIPLFGHVGSLNVSVAAGVALYEAVRQRGAVPSHVRPIPVRAAAGPRIVGPGAEDGETDPGLVARYVGEDDEEEEADESRADPVGLGEDDDRPAWSGPTVLKPVSGPRRDHGAGREHGRGRDGQGHGRGRGPRRDQGSRPPGPGDPPPSGERSDVRNDHGDTRHAGGPPAGPSGPRGRRRRRRGGGPRPGGNGPAEPPRTHDGGRAHPQHEHGHREGPQAPPRPNAPDAPQPSSPDAPPGAPGGPEGAFSKRRRRRRRRH
jgi:23S rRNA (guanosine2251-2'-O)-methyltransferase